MFIEQPPWFYRALFPGVTWRIPAEPKCVYLTFDDGPIPEATPAILDILKQYDVRATFFVVGDNIHKYPHIYARVLEEGHRVGNHTFHHIKGTKFSLDDYLRDIDACEQAMSTHSLPFREGTGVGLFRPPYGKMTFRQKRAILERGYEIILWDVLTHDYNRTYSPDKMLAIIQRYTRSGSIINFHDSVKSADRIIAVLPRVIEWLLKNGYSIELL